MFTILLLYRRAPRPLRFLAWVVVLIVVVSTLVRLHTATQALQERNSNVHTHRHTR